MSVKKHPQSDGTVDIGISYDGVFVSVLPCMDHAEADKALATLPPDMSISRPYMVLERICNVMTNVVRERMGLPPIQERL